jgi:hypothetical protein
MKEEDAFESGLYWAFYNYLEEELIDFMRKVPYIDEHKKVHSPALLAQLLLNCSYIDTAFKDMARFNGFTNEQNCRKILEADEKKEFDIPLARDAFEPLYKLSKRKVIAKLDWCGDRELVPFERFGKKEYNIPSWWTAYNSSKHDWTKAFGQANLNNALVSLAGAFLLNAVHFPSIEFLFKLGALEFGAWQKDKFTPVEHSLSQFKQFYDEAVKDKNTQIWDLRFETRLFIFADDTSINY